MHSPLLARPAGGWGLRYASHIGFRFGERPLFLELGGGFDAIAQVNFAARLGFSGVLNPWARVASRAQNCAFGAAARELGIEASCVMFAGIETVRSPIWTKRDRESREALTAHIRAACDVAKLISSRTVAVVATADTKEPLAPQRKAMRENLADASSLAAECGVTLAVETMLSLPDMLLGNNAQILDLLADIGSPNVKLIFDTHHVAAIEGVDAVLESFKSSYAHISVLQLADYPIKYQPDTGEIAFLPILVEAMTRAFDGLVDLEFHWSLPGADGEVAGLKRFVELDSAARVAAGRSDLIGVV